MPEFEWLLQILRAFNRGSIVDYKALAVKHQAQAAAVPALATNEQTLLEKITILGLLELVFALPSDQRLVSFDTIAKATQLPLGEVRLRPAPR